jgi:hypothetical protein
MTDADNELQELRNRFAVFGSLDTVRDAEARKNSVRELEARIRAGTLTIPLDQAQECLGSSYELARILVHLLIENGKVTTGHAQLRANVLSEWELLRRGELRHDASRMPLYYAVRAYLTRLRAAPELRPAATGDQILLREINVALSKSPVDRDSTLRDRVTELLLLLGSGDAASPKPETNEPRPRGAEITAAVVAAVAAIVVAIITSLDKIIPLVGRIISWATGKADLPTP